MDDAPLQTTEFGDPGPMRDRLVAAIMAREKTATSSLLAEWAAGGEALPSVGDRHTVVDSHERGVGVVELTGVEVIALGDADLQLALDEGEGFASVAEWREAHEAFWNASVLPALPLEHRAALRDATPIVVERFTLVRRFAAPG